MANGPPPACWHIVFSSARSSGMRRVVRAVASTPPGANGAVPAVSVSLQARSLPHDWSVISISAAQMFWQLTQPVTTNDAPRNRSQLLSS